MSGKSPEIVTEGAVSDIDPKQNKALLHKMDRVILPIVSFLYLLAYLDRSNIGNVASDLVEDLNLHGSQLNAGISVFYCIYVLVETPATVVARMVGISRFLAVVMVGWSLVVLFSGFMQSIVGLIITRLLLGMFEGCLFPVITIYLTSIYQQDELNTRLAYFFGASALSGAFGGLLAWAILQMDGVAGMRGWRWLYIIEGLISFLGVVVVYFGLPDEIEHAWFLNDSDKEIIVQRTEINRHYYGEQTFKWSDVRRAFKDPKVYISATAQFCSDVVLYGFSTFLPAIIKTLGYTNLSVQYMTIPVYICGAVVFLSVAMLADYTGKRFIYLVMAGLTVMAGYIILLTDTHHRVQYLGTFLCAMGLYICVGLNIGWLNNNNSPHYKRAAALGFQQTVGNCAGIVAGQIYIAKSAPRYILGHAFSLGCIVVALLCYCCMATYLMAQNRRKRTRLANGTSDPNADGDDSDHFIYIY
ncbi:Tna1p [Sugiyamaella lignohabitans]|uniref:Tna1p n=1 Tax=Sugiyamaella lignohabitans TaxID=796027 RepID=A0A161HLJ6_9ASCO|nr:Tna1p [Sugiyamaella lignohabitans]ANB14237.1 Tna1p [Sugiyamaella lignohabitans]